MEAVLKHFPLTTAFFFNLKKKSMVSIHEAKRLIITNTDHLWRRMQSICKCDTHHHCGPYWNVEMCAQMQKYAQTEKEKIRKNNIAKYSFYTGEELCVSLHKCGTCGFAIICLSICCITPSLSQLLQYKYTKQINLQL